MYVVPLIPKNIPGSDEIPEEKEWIKPQKNDDNPDTVLDEQVWAVNQHKFVYNALPVTNALPYVLPNKLLNQQEDFASNITYNKTHNDGPNPTILLGLSKGYKIPGNTLQSYKINEMITDFNSCRSNSTSKISRPSSDRERENGERKKKDGRRSSRPI